MRCLLTVLFIATVVFLVACAGYQIYLLLQY